MPLLAIGFAIAASFCLGALPLTSWAVQLFAGKDLSKLGTGNASVSAAFIYGGKVAGIAAVLAEIARGILPVLAAKAWFTEMPSVAIATLIAVVAGRYFIANGGGVTNATWGIFAYSPPVALASGITGLLVWGLGEWLQLRYYTIFNNRQDAYSTNSKSSCGVGILPAREKLIDNNAKFELHPNTNSRLRAVRWGCLSGPLWVWVWHRSPIEFLTTAGLAILLVAINLRQADDMALNKTQRLFSLTDKLDPNICGEKAARLAQLKQAGFNVPPGWILPPAKEEVSNLGEKQQAKKILAALFNGSSGNLSLNPIIVRSSALGEDSDSSSAAGQYQTIKSIATEAELADAINRTRQSYWSAEAVAYRRQRQLPDTGIAVLIQPYINSQVAGVMFSRNPLDGGSQVIIEALPGGAEAVVGGQSTPVHLEIDFAQFDSLDQRVLETANTLNQSEHHPILPNSIVAELVKQAQAIEAFFHGLPQDIEWSWDGEKVWILQSRPITNLRPIWTRTIAAEVIPGAIHPLTWSINRPLTCGVWGQIFQVVLGEKAAGLDFKETATLLSSHAYFNATLLGEIFRMMGLPEQGLEFLLRGKKMGKPPLARVLPSLPGLWRLVQRERALDDEFKRDRASIFLPALQQLEQEKERKSLLELLHKAEQIQEWLKPITYYNILGPIGLAIRRSLFRVPDEWLSNETAPEIASLRALQQLADKLQQATGLQPDHTEIAKVFDNSSALQTEFQHWLNTYGYLSEVGTDIAVPTWREQPDSFRQLLITMTQKSVVNKSQVSSQENSREASQPQNWRQRWRWARCQKRAIVKTQIAEIYNRLLAHLRWTFLAIEACGLEINVLEETGDIFYLEFGEIQQWIGGSGEVSFKDVIKQRREQLRRDRDRIIPAVVYGNLPPKTNLKEKAIIVTNNTSILQGIPASIGCVEGYIKVYRTADFTDSENQIIVVPYTDAGWAALLLGAKAIIAEVGGQLSHGAIIAREYGIPAVMNISEATTKLRDGQRVRVDGYRGTVELLE